MIGGYFVLIASVGYGLITTVCASPSLTHPASLPNRFGSVEMKSAAILPAWYRERAPVTTKRENSYQKAAQKQA